MSILTQSEWQQAWESRFAGDLWADRRGLLEALMYAERNLGRVGATDPTTDEPCWKRVHAAIEKAQGA